MKTAIILAALLLIGPPWAKNPDKIALEPEPEPVVYTEPEPEWPNSATMTISHYCACARCCGKSDGITATGTAATAGRTVAVDKSVIPLGSEVLINGNVYIAEDTGVSGYWVDVFCSSHQEALNRGLFQAEVCWR